MGVFGLPSVLEAADTIPVEITLGGRQAAYELIRLYPDRVMVKDAGNNRIEISRREIEGATSSTVRHLVEEASVLARRFPKSNLKQFSELADSLEQILVRIDEASLLYGWLLPEASSTARLMRQTDQPVKQTQTIFLSVQSEYDNMLTQVQAGTPLDVNWEEFFARLEQRAGGIPFATVKKEFLAKVRKDIQKLKDRIRSSCEDRVAAIQKQMNQVEGLLADGTLTRDQWQASLQQLQQVAAAIPESGLKAKWSQEIQAFQKSVSQQYAQLEEKRELKKLEEAISQAETRISSASPDLSSLEKELGDLRLQVSQFPESPTQAALSTHLAELREQVASKSIAMASAALAARQSQLSKADGLLASLQARMARFLGAGPAPAKAAWWILGAGGGLVFILVLARLFRRTPRPALPTPMAPAPVQIPAASSPLEITPQIEPALEPAPAMPPTETVIPDPLPREDVLNGEPPLVEESEEEPLLEQEAPVSEVVPEQPLAESLPSLPESFEEIPPFPAPPFQVTFDFPDWSQPPPDEVLSRVVRSAECRARLKEGFPLAAGIPLSLHQAGRWLFLLKSHNENETEIMALDRFGDQAELFSITRFNPQQAACCIYRDQAWILEGEVLSAHVFSEGCWAEKIHIDLPHSAGIESNPDGSAWIPRLWVTDHVIAFSRTSATTEGFWLDYEGSHLSFSAWDNPIQTEICYLSAAANAVLGVTRQGDSLRIEPEEKRWTLPGNLPGVAESLAESLPAGIKDHILYCPQRGEEQFWKVCSWDMAQQSMLTQSAGNLGKPLSLHVLEDGVVLLNDKGVFFLDTPYLSLRWDFFALKGQPVRVAVDLVQTALLIRHEDLDSILVLGRNSGVDLWEITPEEHGLKSIHDLLIYDDQVLLLGLSLDGTGCLKLV